MIQIIIAAAFGLIIGSFLNVCIYRLPKGRSIVNPPSSCPLCGKPIQWCDNIPVLSFLMLGGRCRSCGKRISLRYIIVEIMTAVIIACIYAAFGLSAKFFAYSLMSCGLIVATFVDFEIQEIPDEISVGGIVAGMAAAILLPGLFGMESRLYSFAASISGVIVGAGSIYLMGYFGELVFKKEAMGGGDVKLMGMIGAFLGWKMTLLVFFLAPLFGSIAGIVLRLKDGREIMPYGPYLSLAAIIAVFFGNKIISLFWIGG